MPPTWLVSEFLSCIATWCSWAVDNRSVTRINVEHRCDAEDNDDPHDKAGPPEESVEHVQPPQKVMLERTANGLQCH